jgi:hypothetical protein
MFVTSNSGLKRDHLSEKSNGREADFERASARLREGLKTCRTVVDDYRAQLGVPSHPVNDDEGPVQDERSGV